MKYILITGSPITGFIYEGPFDDPTEAGDFARETSPRNSKYWIAPIREPEEESTFHYRPDSARLKWKAEGKDKELCKIVEDHLENKEIRHKDGNPRNYSIDNLELVPIKNSHSKEKEILDLLESSRERNRREFDKKIYNYYHKRKIAQEEKAEISMLEHGIDPEMMVDPADTESYAASLPGTDYHDIMDRLDEEDIPL